MATSSFVMGPGTLTLGTAGAMAVSGQLTNCRVSAAESVTEGEKIPVLDGGELKDEDEVSLAWSIAGNVVQDIAAAGLVDYTWTNASAIEPFEFVPSTAEGRKVTGELRIIPLELGGDVKKRNRSDFTWSIIGTPVLGPA